MSLRGNLSAPNAVTVINFVWMTVVTGMLTATVVLYGNGNQQAIEASAPKPSITAASYYDFYDAGYVRQQ